MAGRVCQECTQGRQGVAGVHTGQAGCGRSSHMAGMACEEYT